MKIAFIHFHIKPGGVTTVLKHQVEAVKAAGGQALVIMGEPLTGPFPADTAVVDGLGYDTLPGVKPPPDRVAERILRAIRHRWEDGCDLIHVHNPTMAKNHRLLGIITALQDNAVPLFLQIHDFAEDGRPAAWFSEPYPADCHYGVINSRDYRLLKQAGLKENGLHLIANTITPLPRDEEGGPETNRVLYPIRAIRRKNIGEAILLSCLFKAGETMGITLPPNSPPDITAYNDWKAFTADHQLPVTFEMGLHHDFKQLVSTARFLITTSITEGFGFSYLEPWTAGKFLWGRLLPDICRDFEIQGIGLSHLYRGLAVPLDWLDVEALKVFHTHCIQRAIKLFGNIVDGAELSAGFAGLWAGDTIDFGILNEKFQRQIISRVVSQPGAARELTTLNPFLASPGEAPDKDTLIRQNRAAILARYNHGTYQDTLTAIYEKVTHTRVRHTIDKPVLLRQFLTPENFSLLKWGDYEP